MKTALKAGEKERLGVIRMLLSELKNERINSGEELDEEKEQKILASYAKKRKEALEQAREAGRNELADKEHFEYGVTMEYLPPPMDEDELRSIVRKCIDESGATGPQAMGLVMKSVMAEVAGRADGKTVSALVKEMLG